MGYISNTPGDISNATVKSWMQSPGHRENILDSRFTNIGVGVAYDRGYYHDMPAPNRTPRDRMHMHHNQNMDCIKMEESEKDRTIVRWGRTLPMKACKVCGNTYAPWFQLEYFKQITEGIPKDFWDKCPDCR